jgi:hypothetical protein
MLGEIHFSVITVTSNRQALRSSEGQIILNIFSKFPGNYLLLPTKAITQTSEFNDDSVLSSAV